jgi:hypothetical protein
MIVYILPYLVNVEALNQKEGNYRNYLIVNTKSTFPSYN